MSYFLKPTCVYLFFISDSGPVMLKTFFINSIFFNFYFFLFIQYVTMLKPTCFYFYFNYPAWYPSLVGSGTNLPIFKIVAILKMVIV